MYKDEYITYPEITMKDGTHPIRVPATKVPDNYNGWMLSSINLLNTLNQDKYEWFGTNFKKYYNSINPEANPFAHEATNDMMKLNGKQSFHGLVFRKKQNKEAD